MKNLARKQKQAIDVIQQRGVVVKAEGAFVSVDTGEGIYEARRALSCLVAPAAGDKVLLAIGDDGQSHVLAVLEREEGAPFCLELGGDTTLKVPKGRLTIAAQSGIDLATARDVTVASSGVHVTASEGSFFLKRLAYMGDVVEAEVAKVKHVGAVLDSVLDRVSSRIKRSFRSVEELDQVRASEIDYSAKSTMHLRGHNAIMTAEELVKVDGEQIHLG